MQIALVSPLVSSLECATVPDTNVPVLLPDEEKEDEVQSICGGDTLAVAAPGTIVPVMLDVETVSLDYGEVAMVPVACKGLHAAAVAIVTNVGSPGRVMNGHWDGSIGMAWQ